MPVRFYPLEGGELERALELIEQKYLKEYSAFAIALHRALGWKIVGVLDGDKLVHAGLLDEGENCLFDARGRVGGGFCADTLKDMTESELYTLKPTSEAEIGEALQRAKVLWPTLPWKEGEPADRHVAFLRELEELSRKHNVWVTPIHAVTPPLVSESEGTEMGYDLRALWTGKYSFVCRRL